MRTLPCDIVAKIAIPSDAHPRNMMSVLDVEEASGVDLTEAYRVFGCADRDSLQQKADQIEPPSTHSSTRSFS